MACCGSGGASKIAGLAAGAALTALGGPMAPIGMGVLNSLKKDPSPAGQQQYQAAVAYNEEVAANNAERKTFIANYIKEAMRGQVSPQDVAMGDVARQQYARLKQKYGSEVEGLTLNEAMSKYPEEVTPIMQAISNVVPGLKNVPFQEVWANLPPAFKDMTLSDLEGALPNSSWLDPNSPATVGAPLGFELSPTVLIGGVALLGVVFYAVTKSKRTTA